MNSGIGIKTVFPKKMRDLDQTLNTPSGIGDAELRTIKTLFIDVLKRSKGSVGNIHHTLKQLANRIMDRIPTIPSEETRQRLIGMLITFNQDDTAYQTKKGQLTVSLKENVLTPTMMARLNQLHDPCSENLGDASPIASAVDLERVLHRYVHHSPEEERSDRMAVAESIRNNGGLTSEKPFEFRNLRALGAFPEGFNPQGDVTVFSCPSFTHFPAGFAIHGALKVDSCKAFMGFPEGFSARDVRVHYCPLFTGFSEGFKAEGEVMVSDCPAFTGFPEGFSARDVRVHYCPSFKGFPEGFSARDVHVHYCPSFKGFSKGFTSQGMLKVDSCKSFTNFPEVFEAHGSVNVAHCLSFVGFPKACRLQCEVEIFNCKVFTDFPENSEIINLRLHKCASFKGFPSGCKLQGKVEVFDCEAFIGFPENSEISERLVFGCASFREELAS